MKMSVRIVSICLVVLCFTFLVSAQTTQFTYQGSLNDGVVPANGNYDFEFVLFNALTGGLQVGQPNERSNVAVINGIFIVNLDFGDQFSAALDRFLEIHVRQAGQPGGVILSPRQMINSVPFAVMSLRADKANKATNADNAAIATSATTAGNVTGVVQIANGGTGSATQNFVDLTTDQNIAGPKKFESTVTVAGPGGRFVGNGSGLTDVPGTLKWNLISANLQAVSNNGYVVNSDTEVSINLPVAPQVGDTIRVACANTGGFRITQNAGQSINFSNAAVNLPWTPRESNRDWLSIASSADGTKLVAVVSAGQIYTSTDSGETWTPRESNRNWYSVASSADGTKLVAGAAIGQIYTSTDSGATWTPRDSNREWRSIASSADGTKLVAAASSGQIYTSTNSGVTWTPHEGFRQWYSAASSIDGTKLVAVVNGGQIYTSTDSGVTWTPRETSRSWDSVASSADGARLVAVVNGGQIYTSTDSGVTWTPRDSSRKWISVASSADGTKLVAADSPLEGGRIYTSTDSGVTWISRDSNRQWRSVASSADGLKLVATVSLGQIYLGTSSLSTPGVTGGIRGGNADSVELIYLGVGKFMILSQTGNIALY